MAEQCMLSTCQERSHPASTLVKWPLAKRKYLAVYAMQTSGLESPPDGPYAQPRLEELPPRYHAMLSFGNFRELPLTPCKLPPPLLS